MAATRANLPVPLYGLAAGIAAPQGAAACRSSCSVELHTPHRRQINGVNASHAREIGSNSVGRVTVSPSAATPLRDLI